MKIWRKLLVSSFVLLNLMAMMRIHLPMEKQFFQQLYQPVDRYLSFFSIYQDWMMFAPNPAKLSFYLRAEIEFDDGSKEDYVFPRNTRLSTIQRYIQGEKFRKVISEGIRKDQNSFMWRDTAKFALRKLRNTHFDKIPLKVHLYRHWDEIPNIKQEFRPHLSTTADYQSFKFFTYEVI
jgi:hypothetical protein